MITNVYYKPSYLQGAYNPIVWSIESDKILETDFKYVFDVYINGIFQTRLKQRPNPSGAGMIDVSTLVQGYLIAGTTSGAWTQGETTIDPAVGHAYCDNGTLSIHLTLKAGEEYVDQGVSYIFNGVTDNPGAPAYNLYSAQSVYPGELLPVHVWPSSVEYQTQQWGMSNQTAYSGAYGKSPIDGKNYDWGNAVYIYSETAWPLNHKAPTQLGVFETGLEYSLFAFDKMTLSFINWSPYSNEADISSIYGFRYTFKNAAGVVQETLDLPVYIASGCGPRTTCNQNNLPKQFYPEFDLIHVLAGPDDVAQMVNYWNGSTYIPQPGHTLEIQGYNNINDTPFTCDLHIPITKRVVIKIKEYCDSTLYQRVRLSWLNDLGGRDYMNFTMFVEKEVSTTNDTYSQEQINWSSTTPVPTNTLNPSDYLMLQGGNKVYNKMANTSWNIQTDWLNQEEVNLLQGLQKSPQILAYIHEPGSAFSDYTPYPVTITGSSYKVKNVRQNKLTQGDFTISLTIPQKLQNF